jgi:hypothetical protein
MALETVYEESLKPRGQARHSSKLSLSDEKKLLGMERDKRTLEITSGRASLSPMKPTHNISQLETLEYRIQNCGANKTNPVPGGIGSQFLASQQIYNHLGTQETLLEETESSSSNSQKDTSYNNLDPEETLQTTQGTRPSLVPLTLNTTQSTSTCFVPLTNDRTMTSTANSIYKDVYTRLEKFKNECV